jgi:Ca2+-binding RTX toxin-like protein
MKRRRKMFFFFFIFVVISLTISFAATAANKIPKTAMSDTTRVITRNDLKPPECNGITIGGNNQLILGTSGSEFLTGGDGNDCILGGDGFDIINGNAGSNIIDGGGGFDICYGSLGSNTFINCELEF